MNDVFSKKFKGLSPYVPGEQPKDRGYIKLNTNESPFPPSPKAVKAASEAAENLQLYSDPECRLLKSKASSVFGVEPGQMLFTNGSDEILDYAFTAFCDESAPAVFPDITYGFYKVFAAINRVPVRVIPLREDLTVPVERFCPAGGTVFLANPNAPTGIALSRDQVEEIVRNNADGVVVIDEAYVDFGAESALPLIQKYPNLLVTQTFSKSRSMAGARLGVGFACPDLIARLSAVKYSRNPYNVNAMTACAGAGALEDEKYTKKNCGTVMQNRAFLQRELKALGFVFPQSLANFVFCRRPGVSGGVIYRKLRERGILVRHFDEERICDYNRITVGSSEQMEALVCALKEILKEEGIGYEKS